MFKIVSKKELNEAVTMLEIEAPFVAKKAKAGQFIIFRVDEYSERVPLTIADNKKKKGTVTVIFQKVGLSTKLLGAKKEGESIRKGEWIMNLFGRKIISDGEEYDTS